jgi:hypothetical protein
MFLPLLVAGMLLGIIKGISLQLDRVFVIGDSSPLACPIFAVKLQSEISCHSKEPAAKIFPRFPILQVLK